MRQRNVEGLSERLEKCLLKSNYSTMDIERMTGLNHSHISRYITGEMNPSVYSLAVLSKLLNVSTDYLIFGKGEK